MGRILYNDGKWKGIWDLPKYQEMREKILTEFKGLVFIENGHKYFLNGRELMCVSNVTHMFQEHFDAEVKSRETFERNYNNPDSKYYRMTAEEIKRAWEENSRQACEVGSERHLWGEAAFAFMTEQIDKIPDEFKDRLTADGGFEARFPKEIAICKFWEDVPTCLVPIAAENITYSRKLNYSGTFDLLFYYDAELDGKSPDLSGFIIFDYKTNKDLYKNFKEKKLLYPFDGLFDMPISIYKLQLSLYENNLNEIGFKVVGRRLIWLRPDESYDKIPLESYVKVLQDYLIKNPIK